MNDTEIRRPRKATSQPLEAANNPMALLRVDTVQALTGLSRSTIYARIAAGAFPEPRRDGPRCTRWRAADITKYLESR